MTLTTSLQITLHSVNSDIKVRSRSYKKSIEFLNEIKIPFSEWNGEFNPVNKMYHSFSIFENVSSSERLIYHTDLDEVPDTRSLGRALLELERGECDAGRYPYIFLEYIIWYFYYHDNLCICLWCIYVCVLLTSAWVLARQSEWKRNTVACTTVIGKHTSWPISIEMSYKWKFCRRGNDKEDHLI